MSLIIHLRTDMKLLKYTLLFFPLLTLILAIVFYTYGVGDQKILGSILILITTYASLMNTWSINLENQISKLNDVINNSEKVKKR